MNPLFVLFSAAIVVFAAASSGISLSKQQEIEIDKTFNALHQVAPRLKTVALKYALTAYQHAAHRGLVNKPVLTVIDYSLPSYQQRLWVFDLKSTRLLYNTYVAHGKNSGQDVAQHFSNANSSKETSLGTYVTQDTYSGHKGYSLNLKGLEKGYNDHAYNRRIVIHGAWYIDETHIKETGHAGRSWGCPAVSPAMAKPIIDTIKDGSVVFAYYPDNNYLLHSKFA